MRCVRGGAHSHLVPTTALASFDFAISLFEILSRRQPTVPIAFVSGHVSPAARIAVFHAFHSHLEDGLAPSGGGSRLGGG